MEGTGMDQEDRRAKESTGYGRRGEWIGPLEREEEGRSREDESIDREKERT